MRSSDRLYRRELFEIETCLSDISEFNVQIKTKLNKKLDAYTDADVDADSKFDHVVDDVAMWQDTLLVIMCLRSAEKQDKIQCNDMSHPPHR